MADDIEVLRRNVLGDDLYEACVRDGGRVRRDDLQTRLQALHEQGQFTDYNVDKLVSLCDFSDVRCKSRCKSVVRSTHGCQVNDPTDVKVGDEVKVTCPDRNNIPSGVTKSWFGQTYDTVSDLSDKLRCHVEEFDYRQLKKVGKYEDCVNPVKTNRLKYLTAFCLLALKVIHDLYHVSKKFDYPDAVQTASRILKHVKTNIGTLVASEFLSEDQGDGIIHIFTRDFNKLSQGELSPEEYFKSHLRRYVRLVRRLQRHRPEMENPNIDLLEFALEHFPNDDLFEIISGGHIVITDGGQAHREFISQPETFQRISSHYDRGKINPQYGKTETVFGATYHLLSGVDDEGNSWFQFENAPFDFKTMLSIEGLIDNYHHGVDYVIYAMYGQRTRNIGPEGSSKYTELFNRRMYDPSQQKLHIDPSLLHGNITAPQFSMPQPWLR